jgi:hypothetical protein
MLDRTTLWVSSELQAHMVALIELPARAHAAE